MQAVDSSVIIRATTCRDDQERNWLQDVIAQSNAAIAHVFAESYSALTRMPPPFRLSPRRCFAFLSSALGSEPLTLSSPGYLRVLGLLADHGVSGGAVYDCLIAETAREHDVMLMSLDRRAVGHYALVGVHHRLI